MHRVLLLLTVCVKHSFSRCHCDANFAHRTQKPTRQNTRLFTWHLPLCSKSWLQLWRLSYLLWPNYISYLQSLLYHIRQLRCIRPYLDSSTACTSATSIIHSKLDYCNSIYYKLPKSQSFYLVSSRSRTLLLVGLLSLKLLRPVISLVSYALPTGSESMKALNTSSSLLVLPTKFSHSPNLHTFITSSLFNVLVVLALHPSLLLLGHLHHHLLKFWSLDHSFRYASPCLWNQLPLSFRQPHSSAISTISDSPTLSPITSSSYVSPLCLSITPFLFHSRLETYLFHKSYPSSFTSSSRTAFMDFCPHRFFWANRFLFLVFP